MESKDVIITYQTLYEMLRRELDREELQHIPAHFFNDTALYIKDKELLAREGDIGVSNPHAKQLENIHRILRQLTERRERKIINLCLDSVRSGRIIISDTLLPHEKELFEQLFATLRNFRFNASTLIDKPLPRPPVPQAVELPQGFAQVKFLEEVPKFIGPELEEYGPYLQHQSATLPKQVAELLVEHNQAIIL